jgi:hypothetical protein
MPAKNTRRSRQSQAIPQALLTREEALERPVVTRRVIELRKEWRVRQNKRLGPYRREAATDLEEAYRKAKDVELEVNDPEPTAQAFLTGLLRGGMRFYLRDAADRIVVCDRRDVAAVLDGIKRGKRRDVFIDVADLYKACRAPRSPEGKSRGRPPEVKPRVMGDMKRDIESGRFTLDELKGWPEVALAAQYNCNRETGQSALASLCRKKN